MPPSRTSNLCGTLLATQSVCRTAAAAAVCSKSTHLATRQMYTDNSSAQTSAAHPGLPHSTTGGPYAASFTSHDSTTVWTPFSPMHALQHGTARGALTSPRPRNSLCSHPRVSRERNKSTVAIKWITPLHCPPLPFTQHPPIALPVRCTTQRACDGLAAAVCTGAPREALHCKQGRSATQIRCCIANWLDQSEVCTHINQSSNHPPHRPTHSRTHTTSVHHPTKHTQTDPHDSTAAAHSACCQPSICVQTEPPACRQSQIGHLPEGLHAKETLQPSCPYGRPGRNIKHAAPAAAATAAASTCRSAGQLAATPCCAHSWTPHKAKGSHRGVPYAGWGCYCSSQRRPHHRTTPNPSQPCPHNNHGLLHKCCAPGICNATRSACTKTTTAE